MDKSRFEMMAEEKLDTETDDAVIARLAALPPMQYDRIRRAEAPEADPLVGWFSLGRNVKRTWKKGGAR